jgi:hypothetical protein
MRREEMDTAVDDSLLIFCGMVILLAPLALAIAETGPGGARWKLLTFLCCTFAAWFFFFGSNQFIALVAWLLGWACATVRKMGLNRRRA